MIKGKGCSECDLGYIAVSFKYEQKICVKSNEIENRTKGIGISDCLIYESSVSCKKCNVGFISPNNDSSVCLLSSYI